MELGEEVDSDKAAFVMSGCGEDVGDKVFVGNEPGNRKSSGC